MRFFTIVVLLLIPTMAADAADPVDFTRDVAPILQTYCTGCHTGDEGEGGLSTESHDALLKGGASGAAITAGVPDSSRLMLMVTGKLDPIMPPEDEAQPSEKEIETLASWIEQGAIGPEGDVPLKRELRTPKIDAKQGISLPITAIAVSPDGSLHAIARYGRIDIVRDNGELVRSLTKELNKVNSIEFSNDGQRLLVASGVTGAYGNALVFSVDSGELLVELVGHRDVLYAAVFSPDETTIATAGYDRDIILWDAESGEPIRDFAGHNGAVFDLAFSPDGKVLVSACADETVKVWQVKTGRRLDTLSQPEGEVFAVDITPDGKFIVAGSADNRLRVWALRSKTRPRINPIKATRFVDESPLVNFEISPDGSSLVVLTEAGNVKVIRNSDWNHAATLEPLGDSGSDLFISPDGSSVAISLMTGSVAHRPLPKIGTSKETRSARINPIYMDLGPLAMLDEAQLRKEAVENPSLAQTVNRSASPISVGRGVEITGAIDEPRQADHFQWHARAGEVWAIDADANADSPIDPIVTILDTQGAPVLRTRLQAVRDSYFTFRGKDSMQIGDFRVFNWQEMHLNDYLYAAGEVTRLWMYPRGPDSGYNVYPNEGNRWTYFGTSHTTHALGEPAYIVKSLAADEQPTANGLPVFDIFYENDDDPMRIAGKSSRLLFTAPRDGLYTVRIADTRGAGGEEFKYRLAIRAAAPGFKPSIGKAKSTLPRGVGREFIVRVDRIDGFDGPVTFDIPVPAGGSRRQRTAYH